MSDQQDNRTLSVNLPSSSTNQPILKAIAALADGLRARDAQLSAISEQVRIVEEHLSVLGQKQEQILTKLTKPLVKRTHVYVERPAKFEIPGCACGNADPDWSEYEKRLWCATCQKDFIPEHWGILDGPVGIHVSEALGIYFDQLNLATGKVELGPNGIVHFQAQSEQVQKPAKKPAKAKQKGK